MPNRLAICNAALSRIGGAVLQSETAPNAAVVLNLYNDSVRLIVGLKPWTCSRRMRQLTREVATPDTAWAYQYPLPSDRIAPPLAYFATADARRPLHAIELSGNHVLTNELALWVRYQIIPPNLQWPVLFRETIIMHLAGSCAASLHEDEDKRDTLHKAALGDPRVPGAQGLIAQAASLDAAAKPSQIMMDDGGPLASVRRIGWRG
jgi:hypothetical protein